MNKINKNKIYTVSYDVCFDEDAPYKMNIKQLNLYMHKKYGMPRGVTVIGFGPVSQTHEITVKGPKDKLVKYLTEKLELDIDGANEAVECGQVFY